MSGAGTARHRVVQRRIGGAEMSLPLIVGVLLTWKRNMAYAEPSTWLSNRYVTDITSYLCQTSVEIRQFTRIAMTSLNVWVLRGGEI